MATAGDVVVALTHLGGTAPSAEIRALTSRRALRAAVADRLVVRPRRGVVALPILDEGAATARYLGGAVSHVSAALHHGWEVAVAPPRPTVTVPRTAHVRAEQRAVTRVHWGRLTHEDVARGVTGPVRTVVDCARVLPFGEALAVADSALRSRMVDRDGLVVAAEVSPRTGRARAVRVATTADARAANPFESVLRSIALDVGGLAVEPQVHIGGRRFIGAGDLVDVGLGIVIEAESWRYHGDRGAFDRDVRRYTAMVQAGWRVVRFLWDDVHHRPDYVAEVLADLVAAA